MKLLEGDTALVTGAGNGIGKGMADALEAEGARVMRADVEFDLTKKENAERLAGEAIKRLGRVSIFVHCASPRRQESQTVLGATFEQWREMLAVNVDAAFVISQKIASHMIEQAIKGRILLITSLHAESPRNLPHYSAAKAGQTMVMKELARALGPAGIRVNALAPGAVPGAGFKGSPELVRRIALGRVAKPADIAPMAVAILSEKYGGYMTGSTVVVDGGIALYNWLDAAS